MEKSHYLSWLIQWFKEKIKITQCDLDANFFNNGILGSFEVLMLLTDIESHFKVSFSDARLTDKRFSSINGLADIIMEYTPA